MAVALRRAVAVELGGRTIKLCTAEDLIIHKLSSERMQDAAERIERAVEVWIETIVARPTLARLILRYITDSEQLQHRPIYPASDVFLREGFHVDGTKMTPVDVDESWPRWVVEDRKSVV